MVPITFALALAAQSPQPPSPAPVWYYAWRVVNTPMLHVGLRPAFFLDNENDGAIDVGVGATLQVTCDWP